MEKVPAEHAQSVPNGLIKNPGPKDPAILDLRMQILDLKAQYLEARDVFPVQSAISNQESSIIHRLALRTRFAILNHKSLGMKYLILMAARQDDKGFEIEDCGL